MIAPAGGFMAKERITLLTRPVPAAEPVETQARDAVAQAWRESALEHERDRLSAQFAETFKIPLDLAHEIHFAAIEARIDPKMAFGLVRAESSFRTRAVSPVGAMGLTQLMPSTARWLRPGVSRTELLDPRTNLRVGFRYLRQLLDTYEGNERLALTAYNRGPGTVDRLLKKGSDPENGYADLVLTGHSAKHVALMNAKFAPSKKRTRPRRG
jgi:soluble lytic murein transglycosylase-like protein